MRQRARRVFYTGALLDPRFDATVERFPPSGNGNGNAVATSQKEQLKHSHNGQCQTQEKADAFVSHTYVAVMAFVSVYNVVDIAFMLATRSPDALVYVPHHVIVLATAGAVYFTRRFYAVLLWGWLIEMTSTLFDLHFCLTLAPVSAAFYGTLAHATGLEAAVLHSRTEWRLALAALNGSWKLLFAAGRILAAFGILRSALARRKPVFAREADVKWANWRSAARVGRELVIRAVFAALALFCLGSVAYVVA
jgi:hypothetical protein